MKVRKPDQKFELVITHTAKQFSKDAIHVLIVNSNEISVRSRRNFSEMMTMNKKTAVAAKLKHALITPKIFVPSTMVRSASKLLQLREDETDEVAKKDSL